MCTSNLFPNSHQNPPRQKYPPAILHQLKQYEYKSNIYWTYELLRSVISSTSSATFSSTLDVMLSSSLIFRSFRFSKSDISSCLQGTLMTVLADSNRYYSTRLKALFVQQRDRGFKEGGVLEASKRRGECEVGKRSVCGDRRFGVLAPLMR